jgi:hypothetical protein
MVMMFWFLFTDSMSQKIFRPVALRLSSAVHPFLRSISRNPIASAWWAICPISCLDDDHAPGLVPLVCAALRLAPRPPGRRGALAVDRNCGTLVRFHRMLPFLVISLWFWSRFL